MGRKDRYETLVKPRLEEIHEMYQTLTEREIAQRLGIGKTTFENYKRDHEELRNALKKAKEELVKRMKESLKKRGEGFYYKETKRVIRKIDGKKNTVIEEYEKYCPPDVGAIHLILKNYDENWRNDDVTTLELKKQKLEIDKQKAEEVW